MRLKTKTCFPATFPAGEVASMFALSSIHYLASKRNVLLRDVAGKINTMKLSTPMLSMVSLATAYTLLICSCKSKRQARFEITNSTGHTIKNLTIQPDIDVNKYVDIEPNQKVIFKTSMTGMPKADGNYGLSFQGGRFIHRQDFRLFLKQPSTRKHH